MAEYRGLLPTIDEESRPYWEAARRHELVVQRCAECAQYSFPFYPICSNCGSVDRQWVRVSGRGTVYSWAIVHSTKEPAFADQVPYALVVAELDEQEGLRIPGRIIDCQFDEIRPGLPIEVVFQDVTEDVTLSNWAPLRHSTS